jgi:6-phosphofructokinase 1
MSTSLTERDRARRVVAADLEIQILGPCVHPSPITERLAQSSMHYVGRADRVLLDDRRSTLLDAPEALDTQPSFELAGPRDKIFFVPNELSCGIVTCGGLCPGLNNVIRGLVLELCNGYGVSSIYGFRYGFEGIVRRHGLSPLRLTPDVVAGAQNEGGTLLGSSRGNQDPGEIVDRLEELGIRVLFVIGGDGTFRGAMSIVSEIERRKLSMGVIGVPKTIDNDIHFIDRSFGFESAFSAAVEVIRSAHAEAMGARNGISIVKLMGRHSGFIACHAALASTDVDVVLIPESTFQLEGKGGLFDYLQTRLEERSHAVIVVAEGAGQELCRESDTGGGAATDASGNVRLEDIGLALKERITRHFAQRRIPISLKYLDPSYHIRSVPASPADSVYCWHLARNAVHAAMAGNTNMLIGRWHGRFVHVPMPLATRYRKQVNISEDLWAAVVESTGQPYSFDATE